MRGDLPFLRSGPVWRVRESAREEVDRVVERHGYLRLDLDGRLMTSRAAAHAELARALEFPEWYGGNWDAFHDCMYAVESAHRGERIAVVWNDFEAAAAAAPVTAAEVLWALLEVRHERDLVLDLFVLGSGPDFDGPDDAA